MRRSLTCETNRQSLARVGREAGRAVSDMLQEQPDVNNNTALKREPTAAEIRAQVERVLGSRCFEQAGRSSKFLRFVTEQTLAGQSERLKGYTIAVEVF